MKKNYFLKVLFTFVLSGFFSFSYAINIYLSSTGLDTNDGLTPETAVASFSKAQAIAFEGDVIKVSGMIDFWSDPENTTFAAATGGFSTTNKTGIVLAKSLTIEGASPEYDGFEGTNGSNSTRLIQVTNALHTLTLKNLTFRNGSFITDVTTIAVGGGAIAMTTGNIVAENVIFDSNSVSGHGTILGGAIFIGNTNTNTTSFKNCVFSNNHASKSGAIYIANWAASTEIRFEGCSFISNEAKLAFGGSALFVLGNNANTTLSMINCTVANNKVQSAANGGAVYVYKGTATTVVNIINCTITENTAVGTAANGAGLFMLNSIYLGRLNVSNSIIENNRVAGDLYADFSTNAAPTAATLQFNNSFIGRSSGSLAVPEDCIGSTNQFNYLIDQSYPNGLLAELAAFDTENNIYPLLSSSPAINYGKSSYLKNLTPAVLTDQIGRTRPAENCSAGAYEYETMSGVQNATNSSIEVYRNSNNQITVKSATTKDGMIAIYNVEGQRVVSSPINGITTHINKSLVPGLYIVSVSIDGKIYTAKVLLN